MNGEPEKNLVPDPVNVVGDLTKASFWTNVAAAEAAVAAKALDGTDIASSKKWSRGESNPRARAVSPENHASSAERAAPGAARSARGGNGARQPANEAAPDATGSPVSASGAPGGTEPPDPDLARVVAAWAGLPEAVRRGVVAMVEGVG